jgi:hypothetical protein
MIGPDPVALRYPDPPPPPTAWWGWRRQHGSDDPWMRVLGADAPTRGACYQALMDGSELVGHEGQWSYLILPAGEKPAGQTRRPGN